MIFRASLGVAIEKICNPVDKVYDAGEYREQKLMSRMSNFDNSITSSLEMMSELPKPAELITLPSYMDCHEHAYTQIVIGLKGQVEFEVRGQGNIVGPGQGF